MKRLLFAFLTILASGHVQAQAVGKAEAEIFFKRYMALSSAFDTKIGDLYAPSAKITGYKQNEGGAPEKQEVTGAQWKQLLSFNMAKAKKRNDRSTFSQIAYEPIGERMRVKALRYSVAKCATDDSYSMLIGRQSGKLLIEEETFKTHLPSNCK